MVELAKPPEPPDSAPSAKQQDAAEEALEILRSTAHQSPEVRLMGRERAREMMRLPPASPMSERG